jgi:hypothetical protein
VRPAFRGLRHTPEVVAAIDHIQGPLVGEVVDEHIHLPVITHDACTDVADVIAGHRELRIRIVKWYLINLIEGVTGKRPLEADEEIISTQPVRRPVMLDPR